MKLNEFFQTQKDLIFTDVDKLELYQKFLYKKTAKSPIKRFSFVHARSFVYSMIAAVMVLGMYGTYFFSNTSNIATNLVQADYIAKVLSVNGDFSIEHGGTLSQTKDISNGDTIILDKDTEIVFEISSGTKSKIIWPAKLTIQKVSEDTTKYKLNLIYGDYIQMEGTRVPQTVELAIDDILIRQADKTQPLNFQFINEGKGHIIKNNGASLLVTKNGDSKQTQIKNNQILAIQKSDITLFQDWKDFSKAMQKGEVSQTFAVNTSKYDDIKTSVTDSQSWEKSEDTTLSFMALLAPEAEKSIIEDNVVAIKEDIATIINQKKVLEEDQNALLRSTLGAYFLNNEMEDAYNAKLASTDATAKITTKIKQMYKAFGLAYTDGSLSSSITNLSQLLQKWFSIPPTYISNLGILNNRLVALDKVTTTSPSREEFQKTLANTLIFK